MPYSSLNEFTELVAEEAHIACSAISSLHVLKQAEGSSEKIQKHLKASALVTSTRHFKIKEGHKAPKGNNSDDQTSWQMKYHFCKLNDFIYKYEGFQALLLNKKKRFVLSNNMCLSCHRVGDFTKDCKRKVTCNNCKQINPTPLHEEQSKTKGAETTKKKKISTAFYCKQQQSWLYQYGSPV